HPGHAPQPSSVTPLQSSSTPLHASVGGTHASQAHEALHARVPAVPHVVVQGPVAPGEHAKPSSTRLSQSSSPPPHVSAGGVHAPHEQSPAQVRLPVDPHDVVHAPVRPAQHAKPSSHAPLQSSSVPLHSSA